MVWAATVVAQFVLNLVLIPRLGIVGAAAGTTLATCFVTISLTILVKGRLNMSAHALVAIRETLAKASRVVRAAAALSRSHRPAASDSRRSQSSQPAFAIRDSSC
jgi:O-antigen/teichoic acid export membrane protein